MILSSPCVSTYIVLAAQPSRMKYSPGETTQIRVTVLSLSPSFSFSLSFFCQMMKVRLQQPSGTELPPFNPILPPASIRQVVLLANPFKVWILMDLNKLGQVGLGFSVSCCFSGRRGGYCFGNGSCFRAKSCRFYVSKIKATLAHD